MRVVPGPDPNQFGVIAKPYKAPTENLMQKNKRLEEARDTIVRQEKELQSELLKINFFDDSTKKAKVKQIKRTVDEIMNQRYGELNEKRQKLKMLLAQEEQNYQNELEMMIESPLERAAKLREKAKKIQTERQREKQEFVQEMMDLKWRSECDELRNLQSKYLTSELREEHFRQMDEKKIRNQQEVEYEAMFAQLMHNDMLSKKEREENEARLARARNMETAEILREQMRILEQQKLKERELRMENARLSQERVNIERIERELAHRQKIRQQQARKEELDTSVRIKMQNEARRAREEMALDLMLLEDALATSQSEEEERSRRKQELLEEGNRYREYLKVQLEEEKRKEKDLEMFIDAEVEKQFQKRLNQWRAEKEARKRLLEEVVRERKIQIQEKIERNEERQRELEIEKIEVRRKIEHYAQLEENEQAKIFTKNREYQRDLVGQMGYNLKKKDINKWMDYAEYQSCMKAEEEYQKKLVDNIQNMKLDQMHPIRIWDASKSAQNK